MRIKEQETHLTLHDDDDDDDDDGDDDDDDEKLYKRAQTRLIWLRVGTSVRL